MKTKFAFGIALIWCIGLMGCSTARTHPDGLPVYYHNAKYHLTFWLPDSWRGYSVVIQEWKGFDPPYAKGAREEHGPIIALRNPKWMPGEPYQDIPIMVFTRNQWDEEHQGRFFPYAGGIIYEMWHNDQYVFGNYSRYNFSELNGWKETDDIISRNCAAHPGEHLYPE